MRWGDAARGDVAGADWKQGTIIDYLNAYCALRPRAERMSA
jgi:hypothetical protein